ncbi:putative bifunctional diguanylate cyclase/phosphodiesterase [Acetobacter sp.]|jgi:diguanylate cyclase (GGDEF)-like protein/PAS domain S-box-containing protein|uniref:putative bifunctional diguanylate cyclase/phosphodiesterase n=1 Tax=Acetobacter sp. TaxID=440 RepID=UPI0025C4D40D|nr:EAL domain-containing protein [Acetobacter sp.]MCH4091330.1 EAL domain-containing protein [Acetobacter sp.]MCI1299308.1 EAL domain-containing protein [Acetobacter sp.]MCI1316688.1 EAL domain-containing protein [Acetobacter sp.]
MKEQSVRIPDNDPVEQNIRFFRSAIDEVLIVAITDVNGVITHVNDRFCQISGYSRHELLGHTHRILNSGYHSEDFFRNLYATLRAGEIWRGKICNRAKDGSLYWVATTIIPRKDDQGKNLAYVAYRFDVTPLVEARNRMKHLARQDPLVDALNRIGFSEGLATTLEETGAAEETRLMVRIDLDGFKEVNDIYGHDAGDTVLIEVALRLRTFAGPDAVIGRLGGDEFAIIMDGPDPGAYAEKHLQHLLSAIEVPVVIEETCVSVSASIGYTFFSSATASGQQFLKEADIALLQAKQRGGKSVIAFTPGMGIKAKNHQLLMSQIHLAVERGELEMYYQPIINLSLGRVTACEALLRWHHPELGLLTPVSFPEVFSDFRTGLAIGKFVRQSVIRDLATWIETGDYTGNVTLNVSMADFGTDGLTREFCDLTKAAGVPRDRVQVEITETIFLGATRSDRVRREIFKLSRHGFKIAFDDFGTGYAAISHLRELPLTHIKIDRSFIKNIDQSVRDLKITSGLIRLARSIDMAIIAEGVETVEQLRILNDLGCTACQGYLFAMPVPVTALPDAVENAGTILDDFRRSTRTGLLSGSV